MTEKQAEELLKVLREIRDRQSVSPYPYPVYIPYEKPAIPPAYPVWVTPWGQAGVTYYYQPDVSSGNTTTF